MSRGRKSMARRRANALAVPRELQVDLGATRRTAHGHLTGDGLGVSHLTVLTHADGAHLDATCQRRAKRERQRRSGILDLELHAVRSGRECQIDRRATEVDATNPEHGPRRWHVWRE